MENEDQSNDRKTKLVENMYCRVWGTIRSVGNKRYIGALIVRPIEDYNEISYHLLEATVVHLHFTRGPLNSGDKDGAAAGTNTNAQYGQSNENVGGATGAGAAPDILRGLSPIARKVYELMRVSPQSNEGLHQQDIAARLGLDPAVVTQAGDELQEMGVIYTTTDDDTWAVLEE